MLVYYARSERTLRDRGKTYSFDINYIIGYNIHEQDKGEEERTVEYYLDFSDCEPLNISDDDHAILNRLHKLSQQYGIEYATSIIDGMKSETFTSGLPDRVHIPSEIRGTGKLRIFHSHTIETPLSPSDLALLAQPDIDDVCVITKDRSVFRVTVNGGIKPDASEYLDATDGLDAEVNFMIMDHPCFWEWDYTVRNYMAVKEQMVQTARLFKWKLEGGRI